MPQTVTADSILDALSGQMTAMQLAERLGESKPTEVVPVLHSLEQEGRVARRITANPNGSNPVARWRLA